MIRRSKIKFQQHQILDFESEPLGFRLRQKRLEWSQSSEAAWKANCELRTYLFENFSQNSSEPLLSS